MYKIRTYNQISDSGLARFSPECFEVASDYTDPDAVLLRSHKLLSADLTGSVRAIARAGAGVNNVPVAECSEAGIVVFNTPGANANSVKELVLAGLLLASRDLVGGMNFVSSLSEVSDPAELNKLVEAEKKKFKGQELRGKSLGVVGLGAIGSMVARSALDLGMSVLGFDPAISVDAAWRLPSEVQRMANLPSLFSRCDYVTLHVPLMPQTEGLIDAKSLKSFVSGSVLLNFARQPIVDSAALKQALDTGHIRRYVADFPVPGLIGHASVSLMPHLGASTIEAEDNCAIMAANQLTDFLQTGNIHNSVNFPEVSLELNEGFRLAIVNRNEPGALGQVTTILADREINVVDLLNKSRDEVAYTLIDIATEPDMELLQAIKDIDSVINVRVFDNGATHC